jgi:hypothetical protein
MIFSDQNYSPSKMTISFSAAKIYVSFPMFFRRYPKLASMKSNSSPHPAQVATLWDFSSQHPIVQRKSYSCGSLRRARLVGTFHTVRQVPPVR